MRLVYLGPTSKIWPLTTSTFGFAFEAPVASAIFTIFAKRRTNLKYYRSKLENWQTRTGNNAIAKGSEKMENDKDGGTPKALRKFNIKHVITFIADKDS